MRLKMFGKGKVKKSKVYIMVGYGLRKEIIMEFVTTYPTVKSALDYRTYTPLAVSIRKYALEHGGMSVRRLNA